VKIKLKECVDDADKFAAWKKQQVPYFIMFRYAEEMTLREAWDNLYAPEWMMWVIRHSGTDLRDECDALAWAWAAEALYAKGPGCYEPLVRQVAKLFAERMEKNDVVPPFARCSQIRARITVEMLVGGVK